MEKLETCLRVSVNMMCLSTVLLGVPGVVCKEKRYEDVPFQREVGVMKKNVTCGENNWGVFPYKTYTCDDIRVDGLRLSYGYYPGWGVDENCQETGSPQELNQLCQMLLKKTNKQYTKFMGIVVNNATCRRTDSHRFTMVKKSEQHYTWELADPGHGWLSSLSCMVEE